MLDSKEAAITVQDINGFREGNFDDAHYNIKAKWLIVMLVLLPCVSGNYMKIVSVCELAKNFTTISDKTLLLWHLTLGSRKQGMTQKQQKVGMRQCKLRQFVNLQKKKEITVSAWMKSRWMEWWHHWSRSRLLGMLSDTVQERQQEFRRDLLVCCMRRFEWTW